jgi:hypothetical protein
MSEERALISVVNFGELSKPATVLIEKISDAIGGIFRPRQIRRIAQAEADAEQIRTVSEIEVSQLQRRAMLRFFTEEAKKQDNIESITEKALPSLEEAAKPQDVEDDWITNFFDKCRLISDDEMQTLWSKVLAGQANTPGRFSKRTVNLLSSLDKFDAELFTSLCSFGWVCGVGVYPLIYDLSASICKEAGVWFASLKHLDEIGLISFDPVGGYALGNQPKTVTISYYGQQFGLEFPGEPGTLDLGMVLLSKAGGELFSISGSQPRPGFKEYVIEKWQGLAYKVTPIDRA